MVTAELGRAEHPVKLANLALQGSSPMPARPFLKRRLAEQTRRIAHLEEQLAAAGNGSLFDLKHDTADDIGRVKQQRPAG